MRPVAVTESDVTERITVESMRRLLLSLSEPVPPGVAFWWYMPWDRWLDELRGRGARIPEGDD